VANQRPWLALRHSFSSPHSGSVRSWRPLAASRKSKGGTGSGRYGFEAVALVLFVALWPHGASYLLTCAMGIQNASLTRVRGTRIRTTHVTSVWTDAGDESGDRRARGAPGVSGFARGRSHCGFPLIGWAGRLAQQRAVFSRRAITGVASGGRSHRIRSKAASDCRTPRARRGRLPNEHGPVADDEICGAPDRTE